MDVDVDVDGNVLVVVQVVCMPDSGFFLDEDRAPHYHSSMKNVYTFQESSSDGLNAACVAAHAATDTQYQCIFAQWTSEHIKTPTFPLQSQYDVRTVRGCVRACVPSVRANYELVFSIPSPLKSVMFCPNVYGGQLYTAACYSNVLSLQPLVCLVLYR